MARQTTVHYLNSNSFSLNILLQTSFKNRNNSTKSLNGLENLEIADEGESLLHSQIKYKEGFGARGWMNDEQVKG